nr:hypothetical protein [Micromonospora provocatoris]
MSTPAPVSGRLLSIFTAVAVGCATVVGATATPASADVGGPTDLTTAGQACTTEAPGPYLSPVRLNDANAVVLQGTYSGTPRSTDPQADFQVWDVARPDEPQQWRDGVDQQNNRVYIQLEDPARQLDGVTYAWRVRVLDGADASPWSATCYFTIDRTGGPAPAVASATYPSGDWDNAGGAVGVAGSFTFTSVSDDTVGYQYRFSGAGDEYATVPATSLGGPATVTWTPQDASHHSVIVYALDRAGNWSEPNVYEFWVRETRPSVFSAAYPDWGSNLDYGVGVPGAFEFTSNVPGTESFAWRIDGDGPSGSVATGGDRTATAMIAPTRAGRQTLYVRSVTADGATHPERAYTFVVDNAPRVTGDVDRYVIIGSSLRFHLAPRMPEVTSYLYWTRDHNGNEPDEKTVLPAGVDGTADLTWTATSESTQALYVQSRSADGTLSQPRFISISVSGASPSVTRSGGEVVGSTATFTARTEMVNVAEYEVLLNRDPTTRQVLPAAADGTVTFRYTLTKRGYTYVTVVARNAAGVQTTEGGTSWSVTDSPVVVSTDFPSSGSGKFAPGTFTFKPRQIGAVKYTYQMPGAEGTVAAAADGTATITWTPPDAGYHTLYVKSVTADAPSRCRPTTPSTCARPADRDVGVAGVGRDGRRSDDHDHRQRFPPGGPGHCDPGRRRGTDRDRAERLRGPPDAHRRGGSDLRRGGQGVRLGQAGRVERRGLTGRRVLDHRGSGPEIGVRADRDRHRGGGGDRTRVDRRVEPHRLGVHLPVGGRRHRDQRGDRSDVRDPGVPAGQAADGDRHRDQARVHVRPGHVGGHRAGRQGPGVAGHRPADDHRYAAGRPDRAGDHRHLDAGRRLVPLRVASGRGADRHHDEDADTDRGDARQGGHRDRRRGEGWLCQRSSHERTGDRPCLT